MKTYQLWGLGLCLFGGLAHGKGATDRLKLELEVNSTGGGKKITLTFTGDDQANCALIPVTVALAAPLASGQIGIPKPPMGSIGFETISGPCKKFPAPSVGEITFVVGESLPSVKPGYYALAIDGRLMEKLVLLDGKGKPTLIDPNDVPQ